MLPKDIGYALRLFAKSPGYVAMAVLALGFGIGANSSMFSFVNVYLLQPLPTVQDAGQIVILQGQRRGSQTGASYLDFTDWEKQSRGFDGIAAIQYADPIVVGLGEPERAAGVQVSSRFFRVFPVRPALGRLFLPSETAPGGDPVMLISDGFWQRKFGGARDVVGRSLSLDGVDHKIIGVLPAGFRFSWQDSDFIAPLGAGAADTPRGRRFLDVMARRKPETSIAAAQAEMDTITARLSAAYPETNESLRVSVRDLLQTIADGPRESVTIMMGVVVFVLLIACSNVANLQLARATGRANEVAIRIAMGASRWRIVRQLITESMMVAAAGGALGIGLGYAMCKALMAATPPMIHPFNQNYLDGRVLAFTAAISILTGLISGIAPAFQVSRVGVNDTLKEGGRAGAAAGSRGKLRSALVVVEVSLAMMLLLAAGLLIKSFGNLQQANPGFRVENLLTANVWLPDTKYPQPEQRAAFFRELVERVNTMPGVVSAAASTGIPLSGGGGASNFVIEGQPAPAAGHEAITRTRSVTPAFFQTMGMALRRGRYLTEQDDEKALRVVIVNERIANQYFGGAGPDRQTRQVEPRRAGRRAVDDGGGGGGGRPPVGPGFAGRPGDVRAVPPGAAPGELDRGPDKELRAGQRRAGAARRAAGSRSRPAAEQRRDDGKEDERRHDAAEDDDGADLDLRRAFDASGRHGNLRSGGVFRRAAQARVRNPDGAGRRTAERDPPGIETGRLDDPDRRGNRGSGRGRDDQGAAIVPVRRGRPRSADVRAGSAGAGGRGAPGEPDTGATRDAGRPGGGAALRVRVEERLTGPPSASAIAPR